MAEPTGESPQDAADFRWTAFFQRSTEPLFVLNRNRQILFANRAWESVTGLSARDVHRRVCKRQRDAEPGSMEAILHALRPPREALAGKQTCERRLILQPPAAPVWWDITFLPLAGPHGILGLVGKILAAPSGRAPSLQPLPERILALRQRRAAGWGLQGLPMQAPAMRRIFEQVRLASRTAMPVLLVGESGTGKQWLARTIHQESRMRDNAFVALDCGRLSAQALAWALFGPPGWARSGGATLYLQSPSKLPRELQTRLCEHFAGDEESASQPRLLAGATPAESQSNLWVEEFHCLLSPILIQVPPLRERLTDLPYFVEKLLARAVSGRDKPVSGLSDESWELLRAYAWPGNLHELYNVLAAACRRAKGQVVEAGDLPWFLRTPAPLLQRSIHLDDILAEVERRLIRWALAASKGNKSRAAELLGILRPRLLRRVGSLEKEDNP
jgi:transcriptional regulator with PAS, ATPase and Fis domain